MTLPLFVDNVRSKVAGRFAFKGTLVITTGVLYYLAQTDLIQGGDPSFRPAGIGGAVGGVVGGLVGAALEATLDASQPNDMTELFAASRLEVGRLKQANPSCRQVQETIDGHIARLKQHKNMVNYSSGVPGPERYGISDVQNPILTWLGSLTFDTHYESHIFHVGFFNKGRVSTNLAAAGFKL